MRACVSCLAGWLAGWQVVKGCCDQQGCVISGDMLHTRQDQGQTWSKQGCLLLLGSCWQCISTG